MKNQLLLQSSSAPLGAASAKFILTGLIAAAASLALPASSTAQISAFSFTLDGAFTGGGEWSDVTPFAFISTPGGTTPTVLGDPNKNTLLYAALSHNVASPANDLQLHLMYDFLPRTLLPLPGEVVASVTFPVTLSNPAGQTIRPKENISVILKGSANTLVGFFDIFVDLDVNDAGSQLFPISDFPGLKGFGNFGPSSLSPLDHLLVELEVSLRLEASDITPSGPLDRPNGQGGSSGGAGGSGINPATGMYDPDPVFWGAAAGGDGTGTPSLGEEPLQDATAVVIGINGDGSLAVTPTPEPTTAVLLFGGLGLLGLRRRRA